MWVQLAAPLMHLNILIDYNPHHRFQYVPSMDARRFK